MTAKVYSNNYILRSATMRRATQVILQNVLGLIKSSSETNQPVDVPMMSFATVADISRRYIFGSSQANDLIRHTHARDMYHKRLFAVKPYLFFLGTLPRLMLITRRLGLRVWPRSVDHALEALAKDNLQCCDQVAESMSRQQTEAAGDQPEVFAVAYRAISASLSG